MKKIAIVGLGVIGGSFAKAFKMSDSSNYYVMGIDADQTAIDKALEAGVITEGETENKTILQRSDIVIIALYPELIKEFFVKYQDDFKEGAIITETSGIKQHVIQSIARHIPEQVDVIFGHPMAGRESSGFDYSDHTAFIGANYVLTPLKINKTENIEKFKALLNKIGFQRITEVSPEVHDELIAYTSQLTHVIAASLINSDQPERNTVQFIGDSYRDLTRIAKMNETLWSELMLNNKEALLNVIESFEAEVDLIKTALINDDKATLEAKFLEATKRRVDLEEKDLMS